MYACCAAGVIHEWYIVQIYVERKQIEWTLDWESRGKDTLLTVLQQWPSLAEGETGSEKG